MLIGGNSKKRAKVDGNIIYKKTTSTNIVWNPISTWKCAIVGRRNSSISSSVINLSPNRTFTGCLSGLSLLSKVRFSFHPASKGWMGRIAEMDNGLLRFYRNTISSTHPTTKQLINV
ncbi:MAG: hypothetical protein U5K79_13105 [Cyclobacteriaceae bacterium]|nr:hypothetical protein [Cyclobacteriaceae bacterium]